MELALAILYLNKAETPDKICRAIQYGSKFVSNGEPGTAQNVDKSTSLATKVFRLFKFVSDWHALISPTAPGTPLPLVLLGKTFSRKMATYISVQGFCPFTIWGLLMHIWNIFSKLIRDMILKWMAVSLWGGLTALKKLIGEKGKLASRDEAAIPANATQKIALEILSWKVVSDVTDDKKVVKKILKEGERYERPNEGAVVQVKLIVKLQDGTVFINKGHDDSQPFEFKEDESK